MPFNLLLLPLLAGYLVLARSNIRAYSTLRLSKEQLLLHASLVGLVLLAISRLCCALARRTPIGAYIGEVIYQVAPFPYIGTALFTLLMAALIIVVSNLIVDEDLAAKWLYHHGDYDLFTDVLWCGLLGVRQHPVAGPTRFVVSVARNMAVALRPVPWSNFLKVRKLLETLGKLRRLQLIFDDEKSIASGRMPVMLHMKDSKVIVGYVVQIKATSAVPDYVTIAPSGRATARRRATKWSKPWTTRRR